MLERSRTLNNKKYPGRASYLIVKFPTIDKQFHRHFIRGIFDGDGCCSTRKDGGKYWCIYSESTDFIKSIKTILEDSLNIQLKIYRNQRMVASSKKSNIQKLEKYFYDNSFRYLERKKNKFIYD
jgi:intein/homing endonuclease